MYVTVSVYEISLISALHMYWPACEALRGENCSISVVVSPIFCDVAVRSPPDEISCPAGSSQVTTGVPVMPTSSVTVQVRVSVWPLVGGPLLVTTMMRAVRVRNLSIQYGNINFAIHVNIDAAD